MGEVIVADSTVTGAGVVQAQRIEQLSDQGGLCITASIHEALSKRLPFAFESLGEKRLKGFPHPVRVYRVGLKPGMSIPPPETARPGRRPPLAAIVGLGLAVACGGAYWLYSQWVRQQPGAFAEATLPLPEKLSIAVLPFVNLSDDEQQQ